MQSCYNAEMAQKRKTPRIQTSSFYLGEREVRLQREQRLDDLAKALGYEKRSHLLQALADGKLNVTKAEEPPITPFSDFTAVQPVADRLKYLVTSRAGRRSHVTLELIQRFERCGWQPVLFANLADGHLLVRGDEMLYYGDDLLTVS